MTKALKIPKKIAGVKIPKTLRKGPVGDFLNSTGGQLLIAEAVTIALGALAMRRTATGERAGTAVVNRTMELGAGAQEHLRETSNRLGAAFRAGIGAFRDTLQSENAAAETVVEPVKEGEEDLTAKKRGAPGAKSGASAH